MNARQYFVAPPASQRGATLIVGLVLLRVREPHRPRPFRLRLYPVWCGLALAGWLYLYASAGAPFILLGLGTLGAGAGVFLLWSALTRRWPFGERTGVA